MEKIKQYITDNSTIREMLLNQNNEYNKLGALEQMKLDLGISMDLLYFNYFELISYCSEPFFVKIN